MQTPYSSFTSIDKYQTKEYPMPFSAYANVYREPLAFFNIGEAINNVSKVLSSDQFKQGVSVAKDVASTVKSLKGGSTVKPKSGSGSSLPGIPAPGQSWWTTERIIMVSAGSAVLIAVAIIVIIKLRRK
jgi:hypothetical protein